MAIAASINSTNVRKIAAWALTYLRFRIASLAAPARAVDAAARRFATPPRFPHTGPELELLSLGERFTVRAGHLDLAAWRFGRSDRPVVLMSHGWGGRGAQFRRFVAPLRDAGYQVVLFDHVGHGLSGGDASTLVHFAAGVDAVARHVEASGAHVAGIVGHSLGAAATGAWLNANGRPLRAVLIAAPTSLQRYSELFARQLGLSEKVRAAMQQRFEALLGRPWKDFELPGAVARVRAPALVIHDRDDTEVHPRAGLKLAHAWPGARYLPTTGLGHRGVLRDAAVIQDVVDFLADRVVFAVLPEASLGAGIPAPLLQEAAMDRRRWISNVPRTLAVAATLVAAVAFAAWDARLLDRLDPVEVAALGAFAALFAALTFACDAELREALLRALRTTPAKSPGAKRAAT